MVRGRVKWFSQMKGFGFLQSREGEDVYVHYTSIVSRSGEGLREGQVVEFDILDTGRGLEASNVTVVDSAR